MSDRHQSLRDRRPHTSSSAYADFHGLTSMAGWMVLVCMKDAEILRDQFLILQDGAGVAGEHAAAGVEDDRLIRYVERQLEILFDQNDGLSFLFQAPDDAADLGDDQRRQALRRLVEQKNPGISHQRAPDRQHLQFAAGERAGDLRVALAQPRKHSVDPIDIPRLIRGALALLRHNKVLPDRQRWKDAAPLRDEADPKMRDAFGAATFDRFSKQPDFAVRGLQEADDGRDAG